MKISLDSTYSAIQNPFNSSITNYISPMYDEKYSFKADADNQNHLGATERTREIGKMIFSIKQ